MAQAYGDSIPLIVISSENRRAAAPEGIAEAARRLARARARDP
jgi:hypothetical protein